MFTAKNLGNGIKITEPNSKWSLGDATFQRRDVKGTSNQVHLIDELANGGVSLYYSGRNVGFYPNPKFAYRKIVADYGFTS